MSTQLHSMRRIGLLVGIVLAVTVAVVTLWRLQLQAVPSAASDLAVHPGAAASDQMLIANQLAGTLPFTTEQLDDQNTTAVLFLIDESGGVSGRCDAVDPDNVFVTDPQGRRYELVRFYLQLWRAYERFLANRGESDYASPLIQVGITQFAKKDDLRRVLPLTSIRDLAGVDGFSVIDRLQSHEGMLAGIDANWFCWTDFSSALVAAAQELESSGAEKRIVVLLTDGSSRGSEDTLEDEDERTAARDLTKQALVSLKSMNTDLHVVLLRGGDCNPNENCGLTPKEAPLRDQDLIIWRGWESEGLLNLIDEDRAIRNLAETSSFAPLMPGSGRFFTGWLDQSNDYREHRQLPDVSQNLTSIIVTSRDIAADTIRAGLLNVRQMRTQWYEVTGPLKANPGELDCRRRDIGLQIDDELQNTDPFTAYYWLAVDQGWPRIQAIKVQPELVVIDRLEDGRIPSAARQITVTVIIDPESNPFHPECYRVDVQAGPVRDFRVWDKSYGPLMFRMELPEDIPHGRVSITSTLVFADEPEKLAAAPKSISGQVVYVPVFPQLIDISHEFSVTTSRKLTVTVPITFAERIPGFAVRFGLFQDQFDPQEPFPTPPAPTVPTTEPTPTQGCPPTSSLENAVEYLGDVAKTTGSANNLVTNYSFVIKDYEHALMACKYRTLLVEWIRSSNGQDASDQAVYQWITIAGVPEQSNEPPVEPRLVLIWREIVAWFRDLFASKQAR